MAHITADGSDNDWEPSACVQVRLFENQAEKSLSRKLDMGGNSSIIRISQQVPPAQGADGRV